jgi:hypothetical protein
MKVREVIKKLEDDEGISLGPAEITDDSSIQRSPGS